LGLYICLPSLMYPYCSNVQWSYLHGPLILMLQWMGPEIHLLIMGNEYLITTGSTIALFIVIIIYTELILFIIIFIRISYGDIFYINNSVSFLVVGIILVLSVSNIASSLFATLLCREFICCNVSKLVFNVTGLHFVHVILGYWLLLHDYTSSPVYCDDTLLNTTDHSEFDLIVLYWYLVEALWLVIDALIFFVFN